MRIVAWSQTTNNNKQHIQGYHYKPEKEIPEEIDQWLLPQFFPLANIHILTYSTDNEIRTFSLEHIGARKTQGATLDISNGPFSHASEKYKNN